MGDDGLTRNKDVSGAKGEAIKDSWGGWKVN